MTKPTSKGKCEAARITHKTKRREAIQ